MTQTPASGPCVPVTVPPIARSLMRAASAAGCWARATFGRAEMARVRTNATMRVCMAGPPEMTADCRILREPALPAVKSVKPAFEVQVLTGGFSLPAPGGGEGWGE